jgi:hypothetical protein
MALPIALCRTAGHHPRALPGALPQSDTWTICVLKPGSRPLTTLAAHPLHLCPTAQAMQRTLDQMAEEQRTLHLAVTLSLVGQKVGRVTWVIDQFEEVFTLCDDEKERAAFLANLLYAASVPDGPCTVVLTMRADFLPKCAAFPDLAAQPIRCRRSCVSISVIPPRENADIQQGYSRISHIDASHSFTVLSSEPDASSFPSGLQATLKTDSPCPSKVDSSLPVDASHSLTV